MTSLIILSAGLSSRFGSPKALASWGKTAVIAHLLQNALRSEVDEIIVVLGAYAKEIRSCIPKSKKIKTVYNKNYLTGQTSSFQTGLAKISPKAQCFGLLPVDTPLVRPETINAVLQASIAHKALIMIPRFEDHKGHPPFFHKSLKRKFLSLRSDVGINSLFPEYSSQTYFCDVADPGVIASFNTRQDLVQLKKKFIS